MRTVELSESVPPAQAAVYEDDEYFSAYWLSDDDVDSVFAAHEELRPAEDDVRYLAGPSLMTHKPLEHLYETRYDAEAAIEDPDSDAGSLSIEATNYRLTWQPGITEEKNRIGFIANKRTTEWEEQLDQYDIPVLDASYSDAIDAVYKQTTGHALADTDHQKLTATFSDW